MSALLLLSVLALHPQEPVRYGMLVLSGSDTVATEEVTRFEGRLSARVLVPPRARISVAATVEPDGCVRSLTEDVFPWGSSDDATPVQHLGLDLDGDSVHVELRAGDVVRSVTRPSGGAELLLPEEALSVAAQIVECALSKGDSVDVVALATPGVRPIRVPVWRSGDGVTLVTSDTVRVEMGRDGQPDRIRLGGSGTVVVRVAVEDLPRWAAATPDYSPPPGASYDAESVAIEVTEGVTLAGTLTLPRGADHLLPALVLLSGSGPQDRDSYASIGDGWRPFREIAHALSSRGVAVLRFDDRGVGASTGDFAAGTERTEAEDAAAALRYLRSRADIDGGRLGLLGHSEGARVAMLVGADDRDLAALALLAGAADPRAAVRAQTIWALEHGEAGRGLPRDSVLAVVDRQMDSLAVAGRREVFRWDADGLARRTRAAVGIFQGATDRQVPAEQAEALAQLFRSAGNPDVTVHIFDGVNHLFVADENGDFLSYSRLQSGKLEPRVLRSLTDWIGSRLGVGSGAP